MKGYHPLAGGLLDDSSPLTWTKVLVYLKEPNVLVICQSNIDREEEVREGERAEGWEGDVRRGKRGIQEVHGRGAGWCGEQYSQHTPLKRETHIHKYIYICKYHLQKTHAAHTWLPTHHANEGDTHTYRFIYISFAQLIQNETDAGGASQRTLPDRVRKSHEEGDAEEGREG